ncbi:putative RTA1 domain protein [Emericellopsis atlantica]|uniref:RTA1 domain protein n=1 Tax=Emericellopsis atlantica TaxID=2614577 RepID=A0A9P7ZMD2_9HYPO|nr:putative RTA1 domain protein [Emericellopsis atlantica]KAG9254331.1 putative RTA1 domain protein [Emericellopsis atlantica]
MTATTIPSGTSVSASSTPTCFPMTPNEVGYVPPEGCGNLLMYEASFVAPVLFCVLFGLTTIAHFAQAFVYKKRYAWVIIMGSLWELMAFIMRALFAKDQSSEAYDTCHVIFFLLAPIWVNAFIYMTLGRLVHFFIPNRRLGGLPAKRFGLVFVWLDITAFAVQLVGAAFTTGSDNSAETTMRGVHIYMGGIGLQELFILVFVWFLVVLQRRIARLEQHGALDVEKQSTGLNSVRDWRWLFYAMYATLFLISVRIFFRLAQYAQGTDLSNPVLTHEWYEYVWDAAPMFIALAILNVVHPGQVLRGPDSEFPRMSRAEKKERKRAKKQSKAEEREVKKRAKAEEKEAKKEANSGSAALDTPSTHQ